MDIRRNESGIIVIALLFIFAILIFGYVVFNSVTKSREADQVKDSATDVIDTAKDTVDAANDARDRAGDYFE